MKKILAITALSLTIPTFLVGCGDRATDEGYYSSDNYSSRTDNRRDHPVEDHVNDAVDGVESAADDVISGAGDAVHDIVDGLDGDRNTSTSVSSGTKNTVTSADKSRRR